MLPQLDRLVTRICVHLSDVLALITWDISILLSRNNRAFLLENILAHFLMLNLATDNIWRFSALVSRNSFAISNLKGVTTREIYKSRMSSIGTPPKVEQKHPMVNFPNIVYPRVAPAVLEMKVRDIIFSIVHGIYKNREIFSSRAENHSEGCIEIQADPEQEQSCS